MRSAAALKVMTAKLERYVNELEGEPEAQVARDYMVAASAALLEYARLLRDGYGSGT